MTTYARIVDNTALEIFVPPSSVTLAECFHPDVAAKFTEVPDSTLPNAVLVDGTWANPAPQEPTGE